MKHNRNPLAKAINYALGAGMIASLAMTAAPVAAQDDDEEAADLDRVQVTGSRIQRADVEGALPVTVIDREAIELSGETSIADLLRNTTFNSFGSFRPQSGSSAQSHGGISLRGLGGNRTLVLIDGRRFPKNPFIGTGQDLNAIPLGAVERIEILSDGASAVYGSDAIGGVINIITRKDYEGAQISYTYSNPEREGGKQRAGHAMLGIQSDRGRMLAVASKNSRGIIFANQRPWSQSTVANPFSQARNLSPYGNNWVLLDGPNAGQVQSPAGACESLSPNLYRLTDDTFWGGEGCFYDYTTESADEASIENQSLHVTGDYMINDDWRVYTRLENTRTFSFGRYAPLPDFAVLDADSPANPYDYPAVLYHRFQALGPRDNTVESNVHSGLLGFEGRVGGVDLDFGVNYSRYKGYDVGRNYGMRSNMQAFLNDGSYDPTNPFGASEDTLNGMRVTIARESEFEIKEFYGSAGMDIAEIGGGWIQAVVGAEYREETFFDQYDSLSEAGLVGGSAGNSSSGDRDVSALYTEWLFPLMDNLELTGAVRYDDYSDYGDDISPKIALRYQPTDSITLRASYAEGYAAPDLTLINAKRAFSAEFVRDFVRCEQLGVSPNNCPEIQTDAFSIGNSDLDSENSKGYAAGIAFQATEWLSGSVDFYQIEIDNLIRTIGAQELINLEVEGRAFPEGLGVYRDASGGIDEIIYGPANEGDLETSGVDVNLRASFDFGDAGMLRSNLQVGYIDKWEIYSELDDNIPSPETVGTLGTPQFRANLDNTYSIGDFRFAWNLHHTDSTSEQVLLNEAGTARVEQGHVSSWTRHDVTATWFTPWNSELSLIVRNVADRNPPLSPFFSRSYAYNYSDGWGRIPYIRYTQNF
ncbi:MAG: TonB-dependent receptor [Wenzhouxiangella sp.]|nr:TonB-dependent receptor [Wenzhouxiangella sp.]